VQLRASPIYPWRNIDAPSKKIKLEINLDLALTYCFVQATAGAQASHHVSRLCAESTVRAEPGRRSRRQQGLKGHLRRHAQVPLERKDQQQQTRQGASERFRASAEATREGCFRLEQRPVELLSHDESANDRVAVHGQPLDEQPRGKCALEVRSLHYQARIDPAHRDEEQRIQQGEQQELS
jgi:hypothetical protein